MRSPAGRARVVVIPDSFKGSLGSAEVAAHLAAGLASVLPDATIVGVPVADGGEGTVDAFLAAVGGERRALEVTGPLGHPVTAAWALLPDGTAVVEMAQAAGLPLVGRDLRVLETTTYGVGQLIAAAAASGAARLVVGLGGSATNDGGAGAAAALGVVFRDAAGEAFVPVGGTLGRIASIDVSGLDARVAALPVTVMCDIDNPLCGPRGASAVFGPQKGAGPDDVPVLDAGLAHLAALVRRDVGVDVADLPGSGAAGGMGGGFVAFLGAALVPGIEAVLDAVGFDRLVADADAVVTGEGSFDTQSLAGKVAWGVASRCRELGVPVFILAGRVDPDAVRAARDAGVADVVSINPPGQPLAESIARVRENLERAGADLALRLSRGRG